MKKINRREFIRMSAVLAAAGALTACGGSKSPPLVPVLVLLQRA